MLAIPARRAGPPARTDTPKRLPDLTVLAPRRPSSSSEAAATSRAHLGPCDYRPAAKRIVRGATIVPEPMALARTVFAATIRPDSPSRDEPPESIPYACDEPLASLPHERDCRSELISRRLTYPRSVRRRRQATIAHLRLLRGDWWSHAMLARQVSVARRRRTQRDEHTGIPSRRS